STPNLLRRGPPQARPAHQLPRQRFSSIRFARLRESHADSASSHPALVTIASCCTIASPEKGRDPDAEAFHTKAFFEASVSVVDAFWRNMPIAVGYQ
ncbi:hypothetical protein, partial [Mesorhizobium sp. M0254]|uniref:hypothetical protein n=1 Tax=Mesorhizobium sp. M0254 TaxID=2956927 RepID=UPI00333CE3A4